MIILFQNILFSIQFLACKGCFGLLTNIKKGSGTSFCFTFSAWFHIFFKVFKNGPSKICGRQPLTLSRKRPISYRNQSIDLQRNSMYWFLYDIALRRERVKKFEVIWSDHISSLLYDRPYHFKVFKGYLPQILLGTFLDTLTHLSLGKTFVCSLKRSI